MARYDLISNSNSSEPKSYKNQKSNGGEQA